MTFDEHNNVLKLNSFVLPEDEDRGLFHGDCLHVLPYLKENSIDTCISDPPYGLSFMGASWDHKVPGPEYWEEVFRVLKPGAILLAFGGTRTWHRLTCAIVEGYDE